MEISLVVSHKRQENSRQLQSDGGIMGWLESTKK